MEKEKRETGREALLIVDDDAINRAILEEIFSLDYQVRQAEDGRAGLEAIRTGEEEPEPQVDPETGSLLSAQDIRALESFEGEVSSYFGKMLLTSLTSSRQV